MTQQERKSDDLELPKRPTMGQIPTFQKEVDHVIMLIGSESYWKIKARSSKNARTSG